MQNPAEKKRFAWGWVALGCGGLAVIALVAAVVIIFKTVPAVQSALANLDQAFSQAPTSPSSPTALPDTGPGPDSSAGSLPFKFSPMQGLTMAASQSLMDEMIYALQLNNDTDFMAPKNYKGSAALDPSSGFTVGNGWCAADDKTLQQNLENMQFLLSINGKSIDLSQYPTLYFSDDQGHACAMTGILITPDGDLSGRYHVVLTQKFLNTLDDGITPSPYPAGDVTFDFNFKFQVAPVPGSQT